MAKGWRSKAMKRVRQRKSPKPDYEVDPTLYERTIRRWKENQEKEDRVYDDLMEEAKARGIQSGSALALLVWRNRRAEQLGPASLWEGNAESPGAVTLEEVQRAVKEIKI